MDTRKSEPDDDEDPAPQTTETETDEQMEQAKLERAVRMGEAQIAYFDSIVGDPIGMAIHVGGRRRRSVQLHGFLLGRSSHGRGFHRRGTTRDN